LNKRRSNNDAVAAREMTRLGQSAMDSSRWREAETRFTHALELSPDDVTARRHYAHTLWELGQRSDAIEHLTAAAEKSGGDPNWTVELGIMLLAENQLNAAMNSADQALQVDDRYAAAWILRADVLQRQGLYEEALNHYHRARSLGATDPRVLSNIASIYQRQGRPHRVLTTLQRLQNQIGTAEMDADTLQRMGLALSGVGRYDEAVEILALAHRRKPNDRGLLVELADCQYRAGQLDSARSSAAEAVRMGLPNEQVRTLLAHIDMAHQEPATNLLR
jgi:tetratricopeptide (TPR) repeat protein